MNPVFDQKLHEVSEEELHKKHGELLKKMMQARRLGYTEVIFQIQSIIDHYEEEIRRRNYEKLDKLRKDGVDVKDYIDIG